MVDFYLSNGITFSGLVAGKVSKPYVCREGDVSASPTWLPVSLTHKALFYEVNDEKNVFFSHLKEIAEIQHHINAECKYEMSMNYTPINLLSTMLQQIVKLQCTVLCVEA